MTLYFLWAYLILSMLVKIKRILPKIKPTFKWLIAMAESYLKAKKAAQEQQPVVYVPLTEFEHKKLLDKLATAQKMADMWKDKYFEVLNK